MYDIEEHIYLGLLVPVDPSADIKKLIEDDTCFLDKAYERVYIPDIGDNTLYGIMVADLPLEEMPFDDDPVAWALNNIPAPGTGAPNRMGHITVEDAVDEVSSRPNDFLIVV